MISNHRSSALRRIAVFAMVAATALLFGCNKNEDATKDYITFHSYSWERNLGSIESPVEVAPGRVAYVRTIPLVSSAQITRIDTYDVAGGKGICCFLSRHGQVLWDAAAEEYGGRHTLMMIDGEFRGFVRMRKGNADGASFCLDGPFSETQARRMSENAHKIYAKKHNLSPQFWKIDQ